MASISFFLYYSVSLLILLIQFFSFSLSQDDFEDVLEVVDYKGKYIGKLTTYHHQVSGTLYAVNEYTLLLTDFTYDGTGKDAFFWGGGSNRPGSQGFIIPDENGKTNILSRYYNHEITIILPQGKRLQELKWFSIYDLSLHESFGDLYIPFNFEPPAIQELSDIQGTGVHSGPVSVLDSKTILFPGLTYDGRGSNVVFWMGTGPEPSDEGQIIPDENGYISSLRRYNNEDIILELPGSISIFSISWISIFNRDLKRDLGHVLIPSELNVPPASSKILPYQNEFTNCEMLHKNLRISWALFSPSITIQLSGFVEENEYMAFGLTLNQTFNMIGSDVAVAYIDGYFAHLDDYNITAKAPCSDVLGNNRGVCLDTEVGGIDGTYQLQSHSRENGVNSITFRRSLFPTGDSSDLEIFSDRATSIIWAIGQLAKRGRKIEPSFHHTYTRKYTAIEFGRKESDNCWEFTTGNLNRKKEPWGPFKITDPRTRTFDARLGPSGGSRGPSAFTGYPLSPYSWYINGYITPQLYLKRGLTYSFRIEGGNDPYSAEKYHPFVISSDPLGGFSRLSELERTDIRILAGVQFTRRGIPRPIASGRLCLWKHLEKETDRRLDENFKTFEKFRNSLQLECKEGEATILEVTPNGTWPDIVYYQSYSMPFMGNEIHIIDFEKDIVSSALYPRLHLSLIIFVGLLLFTFS